MKLQALLATIATAGVVVATVSAAMLVAPGTATAAATTQAWGSQGLLSTPSAVTLRWDNVGNPDSDRVPRDASQLVPHTAGKSYADIDPAISGEYAKYFGAANGLGGLSVTVSQTTGLTSQAVQIAVQGAAGGATALSTGALLQVMQCWGAMGADGKPQVDAAQPDPASCEMGPGGSDVSGATQSFMRRVIQGDPLVAGGDWDQKESGSSSTLPAPFQSIDGHGYRGTASGDESEERANPLFNRVTTNELSALRPDTSGRAQALFETQTTRESTALGCGRSGETPSVAGCWLVIVPRPPVGSPAAASTLGYGPVSPSAWAQRMQVKLSFQDLAASCPNGVARTLGAGSELLTAAMASWIPGVCAAKNISAGYSQLGDAEARDQLSSGGLSFVSQPVSGDSSILYAPVALSAPVIAYTIDTDASQGAPAQIRDLRLDARLVAKLLTQSYRYGMDDQAGSSLRTKAPWYLNQPRSVLDDPEFLKLNPGVGALTINPASSGDLLVENLLSDASGQLWQWLLADPDARSFLNGCPDPSGAVINPFFSTRSYVGCEGSKATLDAAAQAKIDKTQVPAEFHYAPLSYPPDGATFPQPGWYHREPQQIAPDVIAPPLTWNDLHGRVGSLAAGGRAAFQAAYPSNTVFCLTSDRPECMPAPGVWKSNGRQTVGSRMIMTITDSVTAARFQLPTAKLCDDSGAHCVGADQTGLSKAAAGFAPSAVAGVAVPSSTPNYAAGEYPLTMPVYAAIATTGLTTSDAKAYSGLLDYLTTTGQVPGFSSGQLPPGYAPLSAAMVSQAATVVSTLAAFQPPITDQSVPETPTDAFVPTTVTPPDVTAPDAPSPSPTPKAAPALADTGRTRMAFPQFGLIGGLLAAVLAGGISPVLSRRRKAAQS